MQYIHVGQASVAMLLDFAAFVFEDCTPLERKCRLCSQWMGSYLLIVWSRCWTWRVDLACFWVSLRLPEAKAERIGARRPRVIACAQCVCDMLCVSKRSVWPFSTLDQWNSMQLWVGMVSLITTIVLNRAKSYPWSNRGFCSRHAFVPGMLLFISSGFSFDSRLVSSLLHVTGFFVDSALLWFFPVQVCLVIRFALSF